MIRKNSFHLQSEKFYGKDVKNSTSVLKRGDKTTLSFLI